MHRSGGRRRIEVLARQTGRFIVWTSASWSLAEMKSAFLSTACLLSGSGATTLEIGLCNTAELRSSLGGEGIGMWRARIDLVSAAKIAAAKRVPTNFWKQALVILSAGDNLPQEADCDVV